MLKLFVLAAALLAFPVTAYAAPVQIDLADFSGGESVADFDLPFGEVITTQYDGLEVSGGLFSFPPATFLFPNPGTSVACDFAATTATFDFDNTMQRAGFDIITDTGTTSFETFVLESGAYVSTGAIMVDTSNDSIFFGVEDLDGFDRLVISDLPTGSLCMNDFRFELALPPCDGGWANHGDYVSAVAATVQGLFLDGLVTEAERDAIMSAAGSSSCGS